MELNTLIYELGKTCGLNIQLENGQCTLLFDQTHEITIEQDEHAIILHGIVGKDNCLANPENAKTLLACSFLGAETDGGALSLWRRTGEIVLWKRFDNFTDYTDFEKAINAFLAQIIHWKSQIEQMSTETPMQSTESVQNFITQAIRV